MPFILTFQWLIALSTNQYLLHNEKTTGSGNINFIKEITTERHL